MELQNSQVEQRKEAQAFNKAQQKKAAELESLVSEQQRLIAHLQQGQQAEQANHRASATEPSHKNKKGKSRGKETSHAADSHGRSWVKLFQQR